MVAGTATVTKETAVTTTRQSAAFPTVAILRKGGPKVKRDGREVMGPDLNDRFRVDWLPGVDPSTKELFMSIYQTEQPHSLRAMIAFPSVWQSWSTTNEAYWGTSRFAQADNERYLLLYNPFTWEPIIVRGEPFRPFIPGEVLTFQNKQGEPQAFKLRATTRFDLFLPELVACFVTFQIKTRSSGDLVNLRRNLAAIQAAAVALGQRTGAAGIPLIVSRREDTVQWHKAPGQTIPVKKWLIDIRPDPLSKWAKTFADRLSALALEMPLAVEEDLGEDVDEDGGGEEEGVAVRSTYSVDVPATAPAMWQPAPISTPPQPAPIPTPPQPALAHTPTQATADPLLPKSPKDWTTFWSVSVPGLNIPREKAQAALKAANLDVLAAYQALKGG